MNFFLSSLSLVNCVLGNSEKTSNPIIFLEIDVESQVNAPALVFV